MGKRSRRMGLMRCWGFLILLVISYGQTSAQTQLKIIDAVNRQPIPDAIVAVQERGFLEISDAKGWVSLGSALEEGDTLEISCFGFFAYSLPYSELSIGENTVELIRVAMGLDTVEISEAADRNARNLNRIPTKIDILSAEDIEFDNPQTAADLLNPTGSVHIQKTQMGGGSPVIRGFEANKVLIVVDGVRMNNAIFRSGHLQNVISIDPAIIQKTEVVYGPGSVMYGSDALGGVMHFYSKNPVLSGNDSIKRVEASAYLRYASANIEQSAHLDFSIGGSRLGSLSSFTFNSFSDLRSGNQRNPLYPDWGKHEDYVDQINGLDTALVNLDPNLQRNTGYDQYSFLQKFIFLPKAQQLWKLNLQYSTTGNVPRYDRYVQKRNGEFRYGQWDYGPQERFMVALSELVDKQEKDFWFSKMQWVLAYQKIAEDRITRNFGAVDQENKEEDVGALSFNLDFSKKLNEQHEILFGAEYVFNDVQSTAYSKNINTGVESTILSRYPHGGSQTQSYAAYFKHTFSLNEHWTFSESVRYTRNFLESDFGDDTAARLPLPFDEISLSNDAISGALGLVFNKKGWHVHTSASSGFRAPNVDDIAKIFDSNPGEVIVPNDNLSPENAYSLEIGIHKRWKRFLKISAQGFLTSLQDAVVRDNFLFDGQDSILYQGVLSKVTANVNTGKAQLRGFHFGMISKLLPNVQASFNLTYTAGQDGLSDEPLGHIPPLFGRLGLNYQGRAFRASFYSRFAGWKRIEDYSPSGVDNEEEALPEGTPAWFTLNLKTAYSLNEHIKLQLGLENITDLNYREFSSAISAPGRNLIFSLHGTF